ncbi:MAG: penicillin-binding protein activator [Gammaproteobacteria bacterium]|nr:MAG: penicillin-binding protein activator [Gammaproteobacteria bacterium]
MKHSKLITQLVGLFSLALILSACQSTPPTSRVPDTITRPASIDRGIFTPQTVTEPLDQHSLPGDFPLTISSDDVRLQQAAALFQSGNPGLALDMLDSIEGNSLSPDQRTRRRILQAVILLQAGGSFQARQVLRRGVESYQPATLAAFYLMRAKAAMIQAETADALYALLKREQFMAANQVLENQRMIWSILMIADTRKLKKIQQQDMSAELAGWLELAMIVKRNSSYPSIEQAINNWRIKNLSHPASAELLDQITNETSLTKSPKNIAFLLPLTSAYEPAASAIRDGFEAINNEQAAGSRYQLRFYDYGRDADAAVLYYNQAVNDGADIIIGPLGRKSIDSLLTATEIHVPTLLLSPPAEQNNTQQDLFQFSLSQELEAQQTAQRAWLDGHRYGVILFPQTSIGQRMATAFTQRFNELGGEIVSSESYAAKETEFSPVVRRLLGVDRSEQRITEMKVLLGGKITTEARRRQDIGFIFLPAGKRNARLIKPVLDFFYALDLPIYSTSRIFSGKPDPVNDRDLDRIRFPDMPWMIASNIELESLRTFLQGGWPNRETSYNRLYGLGMDIFSILPRLQMMRENSLLHYQGQSGILHIDTDGVVHRQMLWARFIKGIPDLIDRQPTYQGRFSEKEFEAIPAIAPAAGQ